MVHGSFLDLLIDFKAMALLVNVFHLYLNFFTFIEGIRFMLEA